VFIILFVSLNNVDSLIFLELVGILDFFGGELYAIAINASIGFWFVSIKFNLS
jgi:hypothetical protein